jgi:hypothetical protein
MSIFWPSFTRPLVLPQLQRQESYSVWFAPQGKYPVSGSASAIYFQYPDWLIVARFTLPI